MAKRLFMQKRIDYKSFLIEQTFWHSSADYLKTHISKRFKIKFSDMRIQLVEKTKEIQTSQAPCQFSWSMYLHQEFLG